MTASAFAPATVANLGPGFDVIGLAIDGIGDTVTVRGSTAPGVTIARIEGDDGQLPTAADKNTAAIAASETMRAAGIETNIELEIHKGLPLCSGLGSSAASAVAAAYATNQFIGAPLRKVDLIGPCIEAEAAVLAGRVVVGGWEGGREAALRKFSEAGGKGAGRGGPRSHSARVVHRHQEEECGDLLLLQRGAADRDDDEVGEEAGRGRRRPRHRAVVATASS